MDGATILQRSEEILFTELESDVVMMDVREGNYYGLEGPAARIWELLDVPKSIDEICNALVLEYEIEVAECRADVIAFAQQLQERNVIAAIVD